MPVTRATDLPAFDLDGKRVQLIASDEIGATETFVLRGVFEPGTGNPPHSHDHEEVVLFISGGGRYTIGDETVIVSTGDVVLVPTGVVNSFEASEHTDAVGVLPSGAKTFAPDGTEVA